MASRYPFLTAKERDVETGLDYFLARYYSNVQGRFTSYDPLLESAKPAMPQSWNRYTYCLNNPLMYVDPDGLTWYKKKGSNQPEWHDENPGDEYEEITQHVYWAGENHGWVGLDPFSKNWKGGFQSQDEALQFIDPGQEVSQIDGTLEMSMYLGVPGLVRGVFNIGAGLAARFFAREAVETTTEMAGRGLSMEGLAFERKFLFKHLEVHLDSQIQTVTAPFVQ